MRTQSEGAGVKRWVLAILCVALSATGCITSAGGRLGPLSPSPPSEPPAIEQTVGAFQFTLEGGKMITSNKAGRDLNDEILKRWQKKGYIRSHTYVPTSAFTGKADYNLTLSGSQYGESSIAMQLVSGLTLMLIPYTVDTRYDVHYVLQDVHSGAQYSAAVEDSFHTTIELLLFLAAPISMRGANATFDAMADHLYQQLRDEGAFGAAPGGS
jgi:hypothetical protein